MSSVVVINDVSTVVKTWDVDRIRYCSSGVIGVPKTQHSVLFIGRVRYVDRKTKKGCAMTVVFICNETSLQK